MRRLVLLSVQVGRGAVKVRKETAQRYIWIMKLGGLRALILVYFIN